MTEQGNALARVEAGPAKLARPVHGVDLVAVSQQAEAAKELGATLIRSGLLPDAIKRPEQAMAVMIW